INEAKAETSALNDGVNGSFKLAFTISKGAIAKTISGKTAVITFTPFTGETDEQALTKAKDLLDKTTYTFTQSKVFDVASAKSELTNYIKTLIDSSIIIKDLKISDNNGDVDKINEAKAETVALNDGVNGSFKLEFKIAKGTNEKTVSGKTATITFTKYSGTDDKKAVTEALNKIEHFIFPTPKDFDNETAIMDYVKDLAIKEINDNSVKVVVNKISYVPSTNNSKGSYKFTVSVSKGGESSTSSTKTIVLPQKSVGVNTGDNYSIWMYLILSILSLCGISFIALKKREVNH
ncbi:MAG: hypothetical protein WBO70_07635, partial [Erysipelotrichaceae bacterium]